MQTTNKLTEEADGYAAKARRGVKLMLGRQVGMQLITFSGGIVLARTLTPEMFGLFGITTFFVHTLALFGDFGLAPSLVQRSRELTDKDLQVAFTLQIVLLLLIALCLWLSAPFLIQIYSASAESPELIWLIRVMAASLFLSAWRSISMLQLERNLQFQKVAPIEVLETLSYQGTAVALAILGCGVWSLVWATLLRGTVGAVIAFAASPWRVRLAWDYETAKEILRFGVPFQIAAIANKAGTWVTPLLVGSLIGPAAVGFVTWASSLGGKPNLAGGIVARVAFPHLSRVQSEPKLLRNAFERYVFPLLSLGGFWAALALVSAREIVPFVYSEKWLPSVPALQLYASSVSLGMFCWLAGMFFRATGQIKVDIGITAARTAITTVLSVFLIPFVGFLGVPLAYFVGTVMTTVVCTRLLPFPRSFLLTTLVKSFVLPTTCAILSGSLLQLAIGTSAVAVATSFVACCCTYMAVGYAAAPSWCKDAVHRIVSSPIAATS